MCGGGGIFLPDKLDGILWKFIICGVKKLTLNVTSVGIQTILLSKTNLENELQLIFVS